MPAQEKENKYRYEYHTVGSSAVEPAPIPQQTPEKRVQPGHSTQTTKQAESEKSNHLLIGFGLSLVILIVAAILNLAGNSRVDAVQNEIDNKRAEINQIERETNLLKEDIASQYDYQNIKDHAEEKGMEIDGSRVRRIGE